MTKYYFYLVEIDGSDYAALRVRDEIGIKEALQLELAGKEWRTEDLEDIQLCETKFEFSTEKDMQNAINALCLVINEWDYDIADILPRLKPWGSRLTVINTIRTRF